MTAFVGRLRSKVELCDFESTSVDTVTNGQLRDQSIEGLRNNDIRKDLLKEVKLTLAHASSVESGGNRGFHSRQFSVRRKTAQFLCHPFTQCGK